MLDAMDATHRLSLNRETRRKENDGEQGPSHPTARHPGAGRGDERESKSRPSPHRRPNHDCRPGLDPGSRSVSPPAKKEAGPRVKPGVTGND